MLKKTLENEQAELMLFALFLLGQFRETAAYQPLIRMLGQLEDSEDLLGDLVTEGLPRIIASVCDGDMAPIVENKLKSSEPDTLEVTFHKDLITDTIASLETWRCFKPEVQYEDGDLAESVFAAEDYDLESLLPQLRALQESAGEVELGRGTFIRNTAKVGRNDPCACGSGKKYKKCCG